MVYFAIMGAVLLLGAYVVWALFRLVRLSRQRTPGAAAIEKPAGAADEAAVDAVVDPDQRAEPAESHEHFDGMIGLARLRFQLEAQEAKLVDLGARIAAQEERHLAELEELRAQIEMLRNARNVSPQYGEAVGLAQRGLTSDAIAERCGISVSEAELVASLSRGGLPKE